MADKSYKLTLSLSDGSTINAGIITAPQGPNGANGVTFIPSVSEAGVLSWTNDGGLPNPDPVNIKGDAAVITESDVEGWGFTKNVGTITEIKMNGSSKGTSGVVDLGTVLTDASEFATSEQGTKADNAMPKSGGEFTGDVTISSGKSLNTNIIKSADGTKWIAEIRGGGLEIGGTSAPLYFYSSIRPVHANVNKELAYVSDIPTNYVTTDTNQGIFGKKWFVNSGGSTLVIQSSEIDLNTPPTSTSSQYNFTEFTDKSDNRMGIVGSMISPDGYAGIYLQARNAASMGIKANASGEVYSWTHTPAYNNHSDQIATTEWVRNHNQAVRGFDGVNYYTVNGVKKYYPADNYFLVAYTDFCVNWQHVCAEIDVIDLDTRLSVYKLKVSGLLESATSNNITTYTNRGNIGVTDSFGQRLNNGSANINNEFFLVCRTTNKGRVRYEIWYNQRYAYNRHKFYFSIDEASARGGVSQRFLWNKMRIDHAVDNGYAKDGVTAYMESGNINPTYIPTSSWGVDVFKTALSDDESYTNVTIFNNNLPSVLYNVTQNRLNISSSIAVNNAGNVVADSSNGITFAGTKSTTSMIRFANNDANTYGNGIVIGGGGVVIMGCGESADALYSTLVKAQISAGKTAAAANTEVAQSENTYITSDNHIRLFSKCNDIANRKELDFNTDGQLVYTPTAGKTSYTYTLPLLDGTLALTSQLPTVNNGTLTIQKNGTNVATFTADQSGNSTANITVPTKTSELTNNSGFLTSHQTIYDLIFRNALGNDYVTFSANESGITIVPIDVETINETNQDYSLAIGGVTMGAEAKGTYCVVLGSNAKARYGNTVKIGYGMTPNNQSVTQINTGSYTSTGRALYLGAGRKGFTYMNAAGASWTSASDIRDKTDIQTIDHALDFIKKLKPITYVMNDRERYLIRDENDNPILDSNGKQQYDVEAHKRGDKKKHRRFAGLSAQDTYQAMLDCYNNDTNYAQIVDNNKFDHPDDEYLEQYSMSYERLVPFLIKAVQEQQEQIDALKIKIAS